MATEEPHEFEEEEVVCLECGEAHSNCECEEFQPDPDTEDICVTCGLSEADEMHQTEE